MDNIDHIAYIYPEADLWRRAERAIRNTPGHRPPLVKPPSPESQYRRGDREHTSPPEDISVQSTLPCIELKLSNIPRTDRGLVFGSSPNSDVVLPYEGVSGCHFSLTFDDANRLIVKDWGSLIGTQVFYDQQGHEKRSNFQWIIGGGDVRLWNDITISVLENLSFSIVVASYDAASPECSEKVRLFRQGRATATSSA